ncbi:UNVERIFIED_CONTAM: hypothetical protein GTU68_056990 [Idotea baltica]|nr:hypothetical protein [Idotea baltica]
MAEDHIAAPPRRSLSGWLLIALPYLWLLIFFLTPFLIVFKISLSQVVVAIPPYTPTFDLAEGWRSILEGLGELTVENYVWLTEDTLYWKSYISSVTIAAISTLATLVIGYPIAYGMARSPQSLRPTLLMLVILPFWTSFLIRVYAWIGILKNEGLLNQLLLMLGLIDEPLVILNTNLAVYIGIVYSYLPLPGAPPYAKLKAGTDVSRRGEGFGLPPMEGRSGRSPYRCRAGVIAGCFLGVIPGWGFVYPDLAGGRER